MSDDDGDPIPREQAVLYLLAKGFTAAWTGRVLGYSTSTINHERMALTRLLRARNLPHLVGIAYETEILPLPPTSRDRLDELVRRRLA